jgi:hypothetical protein
VRQATVKKSANTPFVYIREKKNQYEYFSERSEWDFSMMRTYNPFLFAVDLKLCGIRRRKKKEKKKITIKNFPQGVLTASVTRLATSDPAAKHNCCY